MVQVDLNKKLKGGHWYKVSYEARLEGAIGVWAPETVTVKAELDTTLGELLEAARRILREQRKMEARFPLYEPIDLGPKG